jgi:hypothetical protein
MIYIILALTLLDAYIDSRLIKKKLNVHTPLQYGIRAACFMILWLIFRCNWIEMLCSLMVYWFVFDTSLNVLRKKPLAYLSDKGIDKYQRPMIAFWFWKGILCMAACVYLISPKLFQV